MEAAKILSDLGVYCSNGVNLTSKQERSLFDRILEKAGCAFSYVRVNGDPYGVNVISAGEGDFCNTYIGTYPSVHSFLIQNNILTCDSNRKRKRSNTDRLTVGFHGKDYNAPLVMQRPQRKNKDNCARTAEKKKYHRNKDEKNGKNKENRTERKKKRIQKKTFRENKENEKENENITAIQKFFFASYKINFLEKLKMTLTKAVKSCFKENEFCFRRYIRLQKPSELEVDLWIELITSISNGLKQRPTIGNISRVSTEILLKAYPKDFDAVPVGKDLIFSIDTKALARVIGIMESQLIKFDAPAGKFRTKFGGLEVCYKTNANCFYAFLMNALLKKKVIQPASAQNEFNLLVYNLVHNFGATGLELSVNELFSIAKIKRYFCMKTLTVTFTRSNNIILEGFINVLNQNGDYTNVAD
uniref:Uncharacterized protein n=1 Tax=Aplanochytrium stocchinoi TaxID=215587 RepID=A0A7S3V2L5_9STRA